MRILGWPRTSAATSQSPWEAADHHPMELRHLESLGLQVGRRGVDAQSSDCLPLGPAVFLLSQVLERRALLSCTASLPRGSPGMEKLLSLRGWCRHPPPPPAHCGAMSPHWMWPPLRRQNPWLAPDMRHDGQCCPLGGRGCDGLFSSAPGLPRGPTHAERARRVALKVSG